MKPKAKNEKKAAAGRKGGLVTAAKHGREHFQAAGRKGAETTWKRYTLVPWGLNLFAMFSREPDPDGRYQFKAWHGSPPPAENDWRSKIPQKVGKL